MFDSAASAVKVSCGSKAAKSGRQMVCVAMWRCGDLTRFPEE
jgi:hypothetical protein